MDNIMVTTPRRKSRFMLPLACQVICTLLLLSVALLACGSEEATEPPDFNRWTRSPTAEAEDVTPEATHCNPLVRATGQSTASPVSAETPQVTDKEALVALYHATNGDNWSSNRNWLSDAPLGEWYGIEADANGRVLALYLDGNQLTGDIPPELANLNQLQTLSLEANQLSGEIPSELGVLDNLERLFLSLNLLSGEIPPELGNLNNLQVLFLRGNQLRGEIPPELANLNNLQGLSLGKNQLSGDIPPELANLGYLYWLDIGGNQLSGCVPPSFIVRLNKELSDLGYRKFCR